MTHFKNKDRLDIVRILRRIRAFPAGIVEQAYIKNLYIPKEEDAKDDGIYGKLLEHLIGPVYKGSVPDYLLAELKTIRAETSSNISIMALDRADLLLSFEDTKLYNKIVKTVIAVLEKNNKKFNRMGFEIEDRKVSEILTLDLCNPTMFETFKDDFELYKHTNNSKHSRCLCVEKKSNNTTDQWRIRNSFLKTIAGNHHFSESLVFEMT